MPSGKKGLILNVSDMKSELSGSVDFQDLLKLRHSGEIEDLVEKTLLQPLEDLFSRPSKKIRGQIVEIGYLLSGKKALQEELTEAEKELCRHCSLALEALHAGSLVVDDIQDGSKVRRGKPTLHLTYGIPIALNAGNWLYFWPMEKIKSLGLPPERELRVYQLFHDTLLRAHCGQAIDVGVPIHTLPQERIYSVCMASLELKSGALMALAMMLGAIVAGADQSRIDAIEKFGNRFGIALQMFDDLGNLLAKPDPNQQESKRHEDLMLRRPSWIWAVAASHLKPEDFKAFMRAVDQLPEEEALMTWLSQNSFPKEARSQALSHMNLSLEELEKQLEWSPREIKGLEFLKQLGERLSKAYG